MAKKKVEKPFASGTMSKSQFFSFLRSGLRQKSRRWKPIYDCLNEARRPSKSKKNKRLKWEFQCNLCKKWFARTDVTVDHIKPAGSLNELADLPEFVKTLFCELDNLQVACTACHKTKTDKERKNKNEK